MAPSPRSYSDPVPLVNDRVVVWTPEYLSYKWGPDHPMNPTRLDLTMALAREIGLLEGTEIIEPAAADESELLRIHTPAYIGAVERAGGSPGVEPGTVDDSYGLGSVDNPIFPHMHEAASVIAGGTLAAAREIAEGRTRRAVSIGGGMHHAMAGAASGFCVYNDVAIAISWLLDHGYDRIAYIDVDVHHGDGVQKAFGADPRVLNISIHQHPATLWPSTGWPTEIGTGDAAGTTINLPIFPGASDATWLRGFHAVVPGAVAAFKPQIVVSQCGVDTHREDPLADLALSVDGHRAAFLAMRDLADKYAEGRWLAVGGGGYGLIRVVPRSWTHLIAAALDRAVDPTTPIPQGWLDLAHARAPKVTLPERMGEGADVTYRRWDGPGGHVDTGSARDDKALERVDSAIISTRRATFPLLGLDPDDPRD